ncbi:substrate-binding periplasmic protein [Shewanella gaetbuli]
MKFAAMMLVLIGFTTSANQASFEQLRFITVNEAPANFVDENGEINGYVTDIVKQLQTKLQINNPIQVMPEARALYTLNNSPNVVMFSISRNSAREHKYHWLAHVLTKRWIFYSSFSPLINTSTLEQAIDTQTIGVIRGDVREKWLKDRNAKHLVIAPNYENAVKMLIRKRIDLLFFESYGVYTTLEQLGYEKDEVQAQYVANASDVYIVMSKSEGSEAIATELQNQLSELKSTNWYKNNLQRWIDELNQAESAEAWQHDGVLQY